MLDLDFDVVSSSDSCSRSGLSGDLLVVTSSGIFGRLAVVFWEVWVEFSVDRGGLESGELPEGASGNSLGTIGAGVVLGAGGASVVEVVLVFGGGFGSPVVGCVFASLGVSGAGTGGGLGVPGGEGVFLSF